MLQAVEYMHWMGVMHRDLKLENVMVRGDNREGVEVVLVDFGLAEYVDADKFLYTRCGTPGYVAPEILLLKKNS